MPEIENNNTFTRIERMNVIIINMRTLTNTRNIRMQNISLRDSINCVGSIVLVIIVSILK